MDTGVGAQRAGRGVLHRGDPSLRKHLPMLLLFDLISGSVV